MKKQPLKHFTNTELVDHFYMNSLLPKRKNPTKTFIGGVVIGILSTLAVLYILFPLADYLTNTLLAYLMK